MDAVREPGNASGRRKVMRSALAVVLSCAAIAGCSGDAKIAAPRSDGSPASTASTSSAEHLCVAAKGAPPGPAVRFSVDGVRSNDVPVDVPASGLDVDVIAEQQS